MSPTRTAPKATAGDVTALLATLEHPRLAEIQALRALILAADPSIAEGVKWNAPSFRTSEYFATFHLRARDGVQLILHRGAKKRADAGDLAVADPTGLLTWLAPDRATVVFADLADVTARGPALQALIRSWIQGVPAVA